MLTRLRTWDIFDRFLPASGRVADVGGGPGTHAAYVGRRMPNPASLLRALALCGSEPSMLGCSAHTIGVAVRPH